LQKPSDEGKGKSNSKKKRASTRKRGPRWEIGRTLLMRQEETSRTGTRSCTYRKKGKKKEKNEGVHLEKHRTRVKRKPGSSPWRTLQVPLGILHRGGEGLKGPSARKGGWSRRILPVKTDNAGSVQYGKRPLTFREARQEEVRERERVHKF